MYIYMYIDMVHDSTVQPQFAVNNIYVDNIFGLTFQLFYIHTNVCTCMYIYANMYIYIHMYTCICIYTYVYICM